MQSFPDKAKILNIAYIGGGSRAWARTFMNDLSQESCLSGTIRLYDIDKQAAVTNAVIGNRISAHPQAAAQWEYLAVDTIREALTDADFVILSILPGSFQAMASDVHTPEKYGIYQSVGDSTGPGGIIRALRALPLYRQFAEAIKAYAPQAWVINYTNPMTLCTRMLYEVYPGIKAFGCCHEVFGTQSLLAFMLADLKGIKDVPRHAIKVNVLGINHFTWITAAHYQNLDLMPLYREFAEKYHAAGFDQDTCAGIKLPKWTDNYFTSAERVKFDLYRRYAVIAAAGDRHLAEFIPPLYLKDPQTVRNWKFSLTPVSWRIEDRKSKDEKAARLAYAQEDIVLKKSDEEGIVLIKAILGLGDTVSNVNLPNNGQVETLPPGAVVETNALFSYNSVQPLLAGKLPLPVHNLVIRQVLNQEALIRAFVKEDPGEIFNVFCNDPLVHLSLHDAGELFRGMLDNTKEYLPGWCLRF